MEMRVNGHGLSDYHLSSERFCNTIIVLIPIFCEAAPNVKGLKTLCNKENDGWLERSFIEKWYQLSITVGRLNRINSAGGWNLVLTK